MEKVLKRKIFTKVVSGCICCATQVLCRRDVTKLVGEVIFAVWVLKLLSSEQLLTEHSSQLVSVSHSQIVQPSFDGLGAGEAVQPPPMGSQPGELCIHLCSAWDSSPGPAPQVSIPHQALRGVSHVGVQVNSNAFTGQVKEVVLYFPLHIIREQVLALPSLHHWSAEGQCLPPCSPLFLAMKDCSTDSRASGCIQAVKSRRFFTVEDFPNGY